MGWRWPDPDDPRYKHIKVISIRGNRIEIEVGPECSFKEPQPGKPIPPEDRK